MTKRLQIAILAVLAAVGSVSVAAAQQGSRPAQGSPKAHGEMPSMGMMMEMQGGQRMANSPEMKKQMGEMMSGCRKMMNSMGDMQGMGAPRS